MEGDAREIRDLEQALELSDVLDQEEPMAATEATEASQMETIKRQNSARRINLIQSPTTSARRPSMRDLEAPVGTYSRQLEVTEVA